jgi:hypothetical protein
MALLVVTVISECFDFNRTFGHHLFDHHLFDHHADNLIGKLISSLIFIELK